MRSIAINVSWFASLTVYRPWPRLRGADKNYFVIFVKEPNCLTERFASASKFLAVEFCLKLWYN
jgi:hypothetical protein